MGCAFLGYAALGRGDHETALEYLRKDDAHGPVGFSDYLWQRALRTRILTDPNWPPWLANVAPMPHQPNH